MSFCETNVIFNQTWETKAEEKYENFSKLGYFLSFISVFNSPSTTILSLLGYLFQKLIIDLKRICVWSIRMSINTKDCKFIFSTRYFESPGFTIQWLLPANFFNIFHYFHCLPVSVVMFRNSISIHNKTWLNKSIGGDP